MQTPRRRYVWKLLYIYMLGYDVEFGHMEARGASDTASQRHALFSRTRAQAVELISSPKYAEKQVGYMVTSVLLNEARHAPRRSRRAAPDVAIQHSITSSSVSLSTPSRLTSPVATTPSKR